MLVASVIAAIVVCCVASPQPAMAAETYDIRPGSTRTIAISSASSADGSARATLSLSTLPKAGTSVYTSVEARTGKGGAYVAQARVYSTGITVVTIKRNNTTGAGHTSTSLSSAKQLPVKLRAGERLLINLTVSGTSEVKLTTTTRIGQGASVSVKASDKSKNRLQSGSSRLTLYAQQSGGKLSARVLELKAVAAPQAPAPAPKPTPSSPPTPAPKPTPSSPPAPAPKPTPEPSRPANPSGDLPDATNTGVPQGTALSVHNGDLVVEKANTVIDGVEVRGSIIIKAPGVVIRNSRIVGGQDANSVGLVSNVVSGQPFTIRDSEIYAAYENPRWNGIFGSNFVAERVEIYNVVDPIRIIGNNVTVRASWLHDSSYWASDPLRNGAATHDDSIQIEAGSSILIEGNRLEDAHNAAIQVTQNKSLAQLGTLTIRDNYIQGGACSINIAATPQPIRPSIVGNVFGPERLHRTCAVIAPQTNAPSLSGNIWEATKAVANSFVVLD